MEPQILIAEDDADILELVRLSLQREGYRVCAAADGNEAWSLLHDESIDLAVLDIGLPGMSGLDLLRSMKKEERLRNVPVIFASARTQEQDLLVGFSAGVDDYVRKPFSPKELVARVHSLLKRSGAVEDLYQLGDFEIHYSRHLVRIQGERASLTPREFGVLHTLIAAKGRTVSRDMLLEKVWGMDARSGTRSVDIVITRLRDKLGKYADCVRTVTGVGYQWDAEERRL